jgi:hypothetical protein
MTGEGVSPEVISTSRSPTNRLNPNCGEDGRLECGQEVQGLFKASHGVPPALVAAGCTHPHRTMDVR